MIYWKVTEHAEGYGGRYISESFLKKEEAEEHAKSLQKL
jgi:hypothetical protein